MGEEIESGDTSVLLCIPVLYTSLGDICHLTHCQHCHAWGAAGSKAYTNNDIQPVRQAGRE